MYKTILVDDEIKICKWLKDAFPWNEYDFDVVGVYNNGLVALAALESCDIDLMLTDIRMPGIDGLELIKRCSRISPHTKTVLVSGYNRFEYAQQALKFGVNGFVLKPIELNELSEIISLIKTDLDKADIAHSNINNTYNEDLNSISTDGKIEDIIAYIDNNYRENLSLKIIADKFYFHPAYLGRLFKKETGYSFTTYLNNKRISKLEMLMEQNDLPLSQFIESVGYQNQEYFYILFKKIKGISFAEYRASLKRSK